MPSFPTPVDVGNSPLSLTLQYRAAVPYTGLWYGISGYYRGASATFPSNMQPMAVYDAPSNRTYMVWSNGYWPAAIVIAFYDHATGTIGGVARIIDLPDADGHRNASMLIDDLGFIYVFANGKSSPTWVRKSRYPRDTSSWDWASSLPGQNTYAQPHMLVPGEITVFFRPTPSFGWGYRRSINRGASWGPAVEVVRPANPAVDGVYAQSASRGGIVHLVWTVLDSRLPQARRNLWHAQSAGGVIWESAAGSPLGLPIDARAGAECVFDSGGDQVNTQDLAIDSEGNLLVLVSHGTIPGAWRWKLVKRKNGAWQAFDVGAIGDRQFDNGGLIVDSDTHLRAILPTGPGAVAGEDGGNIEEWLSLDAGETWTLNRRLTNDAYNHNHVKVVKDGQATCRAFWSYGDPRSGSGALVKLWDDREGRGVESLRPGNPFERQLSVGVNGSYAPLQTLASAVPVNVELGSGGVDVQH